eukprot:6172783-Prymnesium_polylepis.1
MASRRATWTEVERKIEPQSALCPASIARRRWPPQRGSSGSRSPNASTPLRAAASLSVIATWRCAHARPKSCPLADRGAHARAAVAGRRVAGQRDRGARDGPGAREDGRAGGALPRRERRDVFIGCERRRDTLVPGNVVDHPAGNALN